MLRYAMLPANSRDEIIERLPARHTKLRCYATPLLTLFRYAAMPPRCFTPPPAAMSAAIARRGTRHARLLCADAVSLSLPLLAKVVSAFIAATLMRLRCLLMPYYADAATITPMSPLLTINIFCHIRDTRYVADAMMMPLRCQRCFRCRQIRRCRHCRYGHGKPPLYIRCHCCRRRFSLFRYFRAAMLSFIAAATLIDAAAIL